MMTTYRSMGGWTLNEQGTFGSDVTFTSTEPDGRQRGPAYEVKPCEVGKARVRMVWLESQWTCATEPVTILECQDYGVAYMYALGMCASNAYEAVE